MKKTLILGLIAMMALVANAQDQKKKKACDKKACDKADKKACCNKEKKCCDKAKKTDGQTGATKQEGKK